MGMHEYIVIVGFAACGIRPADFAGELVEHSSQKQTHFDIVVVAAEPIAGFVGGPAGHWFGPVLWVGKPFFITSGMYCAQENMIHSPNRILNCVREGF